MLDGSKLFPRPVLEMLQVTIPGVLPRGPDAHLIPTLPTVGGWHFRRFPTRQGAKGGSQTAPPPAARRPPAAQNIIKTMPNPSRNHPRWLLESAEQAPSKTGRIGTD